MSLTDSEVLRIRAELGVNLLEVGAEPFIGVHSVFTSVIQQYMTAGASTTSSTAVTAASAPTPVTLTLASGTGFAAFDRVVVDVDARQELCSVQSISGTSLTVLLQKAHSGTYPVVVEAGESHVRNALRQLQLIADELGGGGSGVQGAGLKRVDEIEFYPAGSSASSQTRFAQLVDARQYWRGELAKLCGIYEWWLGRQAGGGMGGGAIALY